jgi:hypothetical protein
MLLQANQSFLNRNFHALSMHTDGKKKSVWSLVVQSKLPSITPVATKVHVILRSLVVLPWMRDTNELVQHVTFWSNTKEM